MVTRRPTDIDLTVDIAPEKDADDENPTPCASRAPSPYEDVDSDIYQTPIALTPGNWKKVGGRVMVEDTEAEPSDGEREVIKKQWASKVS